MIFKNEISFTGIAGVLPEESTYSDVLQLLGDNYEVERIASRRSENWTFPDKSILRFQDFNIAVVFKGPGFTPLSKSLVSVVGAEVGCTFQTEDGLHVGLFMKDAMAIIERNYTIHHKFSGCIEIISADGESPTFLGIHHDENLIQFIGLYQRQPLSVR